MTERFSFEVGAHGAVTALVYRAADPMEATLLLAHGAGVSQTHPFMTGTAQRLADRGLDVVTFNFLYTENGKRMPDRNDRLEACWRAAIASVRARVGLPTERLYCGGKSMGGRIASQVASAGEGLNLDGLVFFGYPLHPAGKPKVLRDAHLANVPFPMLFVQGSRDEMGTADELKAVALKLPRASVFTVEGGDHSLALPSKLGPDAQHAALEAAADAVVGFVREESDR